MVRKISRHQKVADKENRDSRGRFISSKGDLKIKTAAKIVHNLNEKKKDLSLEQPLVSVSINNPFKKILYWLNDIRKKQTTIFKFEIKIPLIALPVFLVVVGSAFQGFFSLGKYVQKEEIAAIPTPTPKVIVLPTKALEPLIVSKVGLVKATYQVANLLNPTASISASSLSPTPSKVSSGSAKTQKSVPVRYVLLGKGNELTFLVASKEASLAPYLNKRVVITGLFDMLSSTLSIAKTTDIEIVR